MDSIFRSFSDKESIHDDGGVTDGEDVYHTASSTTTSAGSTPSSTVPAVVGELSSEIDLNIADTNTQRSFTLQQQHRTISGMSDNVDNTNDGVSHEDLLTANVVVADEELPVANQVIDDDDDDEEEDDEEYEYEDDDYATFSGFIVNNDPTPTGDIFPISESDASKNTGKPAKIEEDVVSIFNEQQDDSAIQFASASPAKLKSTWRQPTKEAVNMSLRAEKESNGLKRRLMLDLYRIMNQDTDKAGFTLVPSREDCMDTWTIKLFQFDEDSKLAQDMKVLSVPCIELEMKFPEQYPFEPPFVRVAQPRFRRQTGFVMNGALCMELLTKDGWNPINDIESVIVSIRSLLVVGDGRLEAASSLSEAKYNSLLEQANQKSQASVLASNEADYEESPMKKLKASVDEDSSSKEGGTNSSGTSATLNASLGGSYSLNEAQAAYSHLSEYHKKKGWDTSGWWARKG